MGDADKGHITWPGPVSRNDAERAALERIKDLPFVMCPSAADLRSRIRKIIEPQQQLTRIRAADIASAEIAAGTCEIGQRQRFQQRRPILRPARNGNDAVRKRLAIQRIDGSGQTGRAIIPGTL